MASQNIDKWLIFGKDVLVLIDPLLSFSMEINKQIKPLYYSFSQLIPRE